MLLGPFTPRREPLNGSDAFENPDGDGYDVNRDGVLSQDEAFVNYLEYHIRSDLSTAIKRSMVFNCPGISPRSCSITSATSALQMIPLRTEHPAP